MDERARPSRRCSKRKHRSGVRSLSSSPDTADKRYQVDPHVQEWVARSAPWTRSVAGSSMRSDPSRESVVSDQSDDHDLELPRNTGHGGTKDTRWRIKSFGWGTHHTRSVTSSCSEIINGNVLKMFRKASKITKDEIQSYFPGTEFRCPTSDHPSPELVGARETEVLGDLLQDMQEKEFPISAKCVDDICSVPVPQDIKQHMDSCLSPLIEVLQAVPFAGNTSAELANTYRRMIHHLDECGGSACPMGAARSVLSSLRQFMEYTLNKESNDPNGALNSFWVEILRCFQGHFNFEDKRLSMEVFANGSGKNFPVKIHADVKTPKVGRPLFNKITNESYYDSEEEDVTRIKQENITIDCKPDIVLTGKDLMEWPAIPQIHPILVIEAKTIKAGFCKPMETVFKKRATESGYVISPERSTSRRVQDEQLYYPRSDLAKQNIANQLDHLETHHFLQLLGTLRALDDASGERRSRVHALGLYVVMHHVYVTGLNVVMGPERQPRFGEFLDFKLLFVNSRAFTAKSKDHFQMVCTKPFNMLKTAHFKALIRYIQYVVCKYDEKL